MKYPSLKKKKRTQRTPTWAEALGFTVAILLLWSLIILYTIGVLGW